MDYIICPKCQGKGILEGKICKICSSLGIYTWFGGYLLFLKKAFSRSDTMAFQLGSLLRIIINILLFIFGLWGLLSLLKIIVVFSSFDIVPDFLRIWLNQWSYLNLDQKELVLFFWFSVLGDCYLLYSIEHQQEERQKNWPKSVRKTVEIPKDWPEAHRLAEKYKIDVASAFSKETIKLIQKAGVLARKFKHQKIEPIHIFAASLEFNDITLAINRLGINWKNLKGKISRSLTKIPAFKGIKSISYSLETKKVFLYAYHLAGSKNHLALSPLVILESLVNFAGPVKEIFYDLEIEADHIKNVCLWSQVYNQLIGESRHFSKRARFKPKGPINRAYTAVATPYLDTYSQDITQLARSGRLGICMNREKEMKEIFRNFEGVNKSVILVGSPGVGKTTIINGLARRMVTEEVPKVLQDKRLVSLNLSSLIAGASQPGEIEQRIRTIMSEVVRSGNIILFIKDVHNMIGVKTTEGELDVSEILADALKNRLFLLLATSIPQEYRRLIEGQALGEAFQKINIEEPDKNTTIQILQLHTVSIESREKVYFSYGALDGAFELSTRYLHEHFLPAKAINLLKEVAIAVKNKRGQKSMITAEDIAELIAEKTKIPVTKITEKESEKLLSLEVQIHRRLIDQNEAVEMVASALRRARTELRSAKRPIVNLLFLGPTGVGKTELAKTVAEVYFGDEEMMIRLDMSEYQEKASLGRLIGSPGGEKGGQLTEAVRRNPSALLLLDEIEKAHPDILNIFLQVMDDGRLTDALGRTIDFTNVILISTSNAGTEFIQDEIRKGTPVAEIQEILIREKLRPYFRPEFLNRYDGVVVFKPLSQDDIREITKLFLKKLSKQLKDKGIILKATDDAISEIAQAGFDPIFGARPLRRVIQNQVNDVLAKYLLTGKLGRRDVVILEKGGKIRIEKAEEL